MPGASLLDRAVIVRRNLSLAVDRRSQCIYNSSKIGISDWNTRLLLRACDLCALFDASVFSRMIQPI